MRRVVITGMGTINPIGNNLDETWENIKKGVCGVDFIKQIDTTDFKVKIGAEVKDYEPEKFLDRKEVRRLDKYTQFAIIAFREAVKESGLNMEEEDPYRCGTIISSGIGGLKTIEAEHVKGQARGFDKISPYFIPMSIANIAAGEIAIASGFKGVCESIVTACASGSNAVGEAFHYIRDDYADVMICGGSEACISNLGFGGFVAMKALNAGNDPARASIPFDAERGGFVMAEGSGILLIEELEHAKKRGAKIYAEIVGYGATCDAHHITAPDPTGMGAANCMIKAVKDAGIEPEQVDYINAHGTSTRLNDAGETKAIKIAFGDHANKLMVSTTKSMTCNLLGGSGALEAIICAKALQDSYVPATINYKVPDPECDLDIVPNEGRNVDIKYAASNSLGFGGHNACLVLKKWEEE